MTPRFLVTLLTILTPLLAAADEPAQELGLCGQKKGQVAISLYRSGCYGVCPQYKVLIHPEGNVDYKGYSDVKIMGEKKYKIPKNKVEQLIKEFQNADIFRLKDNYESDVTDHPSYVICFSNGKTEKKIIDYVGEHVGMPKIVTQLEDKIDEVANTAKYIKGHRK